MTQLALHAFQYAQGSSSGTFIRNQHIPQNEVIMS